MVFLFSLYTSNSTLQDKWSWTKL